MGEDDRGKTKEQLVEELRALRAALASERKRAEETLRDYAERLQVLSHRVVEVQEEERRHLARELHDEVGQVLSAIVVNLHAVKGVCDAAAWPRLDECLGIVDGAIQQVRNLSLDLRPSMLDDLGLAATLRWLVDHQAQRTGLAAHFIVQSSGAHLPSNLATACYRVAQEALSNVMRHAQARGVWVELSQGEDEVRLVVRDDGVGFDLVEARRRAARGASLGLSGMQERIELLGGQFTVESEPGHGTSLRIRVPVTSAPCSEDASHEGER
jgi:signal transduction histidine kinase